MEGSDEAEAPGKVGQELSVVRKTTKSEQSCLSSLGMGMSVTVTVENLAAFGRTPAGEKMWPRKSASVEPICAFDSDSLRLCWRRRRKKARMLVM